MKINLCFLLLFTILFSPLSIVCQETKKPIQVSELIGDTLDVGERDYYHLLPTIDGFQWAVFCLNEDSTLIARVRFLKRGLQQDTVLPKYRSLRSLRIHLESIGVMKREELERKKVGETVGILLYSPNFGKWTIVLQDGPVLSEITIDSLSQEFFLISSEGVKRTILYSQVSHLTKINENSTVIGIIAGAVIGFVIGSDWKVEEKGFAGAANKAANAILGTIIGSSVLGIIGALLDIDQEHDLSKIPIDQKPSVIRDIVQDKKRV